MVMISLEVSLVSMSHFQCLLQLLQPILVAPAQLGRCRPLDNAAILRSSPVFYGSSGLVSAHRVG